MLCMAPLVKTKYSCFKKRTYRVTICPLFPGHVLFEISKLPEVSGIWLGFPIVLKLAESNDKKVV